MSTSTYGVRCTLIQALKMNPLGNKSSRFLKTGCCTQVSITQPSITAESAWIVLSFKNIFSQFEINPKTNQPVGFWQQWLGFVKTTKISSIINNSKVLRMQFWLNPNHCCQKPTGWSVFWIDFKQAENIFERKNVIKVTSLDTVGWICVLSTPLYRIS